MLFSLFPCCPAFKCQAFVNNGGEGSPPHLFLLKVTNFCIVTLLDLA